ncbi:MAG: DNA polymerase III subunit delta' [Rhodothermales bacterium]|nr:DNA polymerase III subunit delta' [Rhodothermales bacterium]
MNWESIIGQRRAVSALKAAVERERVAHAYLFHGPDGTGKRAAALVFAQTLLCTEEGRPCGTCNACGKVSRLIHPDVHLLIPQPNDAKAAEVQERINQLAQEPYATMDYMRRAKLNEPGSSSSKQVQYSVDRINKELRKIIRFRPVEGSYKIAILSDAELLRKEAANAFLKLLEEPTEQTVFLLTSSRPDRMLPTILSRCQHLRFDRLTAEEITAGILNRKLAAGPAAEAIARMADGSFARALDLAASEELMAARAEVLRFLRGSYTAWTASDRMAEQIEAMSRLGREQIKFILELMLGWIRDLNLIRVLGDSAPIVNTDQSTEIRKFAAGLADADPELMARLVEECIIRLERNANSRLVLTVLAQSLHDAMRGRPVEHLTEALTDGV